MSAPALAVVTYLWGDKYRPDYVRRLRDAVARHLTVPHRFYCVTDEQLPGIECLAWWDEFARWGECYRRLFLQSAEAAERFEAMGHARVLQLDLDTLILRDITPLVRTAWDAELAIWRAPSIGRRGYVYNPSLFLFRPGVLARAYEIFRHDPNAAVLERKRAGWIGSDQGIIAHAIAQADPRRSAGWVMWDDRDGVYSMRDHIMGSDPRSRRAKLGTPPPDARLVGWYGRWRIEDFLSRPWVAEAWR